MKAINKNADSLKSCQKCRTVWHKVSQLTRNYYAEDYDYYEDFPHYGLDKKECPRCKEAKHELYSYSS